MLGFEKKLLSSISVTFNHGRDETNMRKRDDGVTIANLKVTSKSNQMSRVRVS